MKGEIEAGVAHIVVEIIKYLPNSIVSKTILNKSTGHVSVMSFDTGEGLLAKISLSRPLLMLLIAGRKSLLRVKVLP